MKLDRKRSARYLTMIEAAIGICYLSLAADKEAYIVIGMAHLLSAFLHGLTHEL